MLEMTKARICQNHGSNCNKYTDENVPNSSTLVVSSQVETITGNIAKDTRISDRQPDHKFVLTFLIICGIYIYIYIYASALPGSMCKEPMYS